MSCYESSTRAAKAGARPGCDHRSAGAGPGFCSAYTAVGELSPLCRPPRVSGYPKLRERDLESAVPSDRLDRTVFCQPQAEFSDERGALALSDLFSRRGAHLFRLGLLSLEP